MLYQRTTALNKIAALNKRIKFIQGGTSASKTVSIMQYLTDKAQQRDNIIISVVSESLPHLRLGAERDFLGIMKGHNYYRDSRWNKTNHEYDFGRGTLMEFFGADAIGKVTGPRRHVLFVNEGNNIPYRVFQELELRTIEEIIVDYNPVGEFWAHSDIMPFHPHDLIKLTYKDNEALPESIRRTIEARRHNTNWWRIHGEGELGIKEGQVYQGWIPIKNIPLEARLERIYLDFGFTNDPTAIGLIYKWNKAFILDEVEYKTGMSNRQIHRKLRSAIKDARVEYKKRLMAQGTASDEARTIAMRLKPYTVADSAEPKSIAEIKGYGSRIYGAMKGEGSVDWGIQLLQDQKIYVTETSHNIWKEQRNYLWKIDKKTGKPLNIPEDIFNHHMDGARYGITDILGNPKPRLRSIIRV